MYVNLPSPPCTLMSDAISYLLGAVVKRGNSALWVDEVEGS